MYSPSLHTHKPPKLMELSPIPGSMIQAKNRCLLEIIVQLNKHKLRSALTRSERHLQPLISARDILGISS